jgi:hypothetical protein
VRHPTPPLLPFRSIRISSLLFTKGQRHNYQDRLGTHKKKGNKNTFLFFSLSRSPAPLYDLGVTPIELASKVGPAGLHCPVSLAKNKLLIDCTLRLDMVREKRFLFVLASASLY